jgi:hypothetical protein
MRKVKKKYCINCREELAGHPVRIWHIINKWFMVCYNPKCERFGLLTTVYRDWEYGLIKVLKMTI